eukprot:2672113-Pyramimonas_sp.AAC.1
MQKVECRGAVEQLARREVDVEQAASGLCARPLAAAHVVPALLLSLVHVYAQTRRHLIANVAGRREKRSAEERRQK